MSASPNAALLSTLQQAQSFISSCDADEAQGAPLGAAVAQLRQLVAEIDTALQPTPPTVATGDGHSHQRRYGPDAYTGTKAPKLPADERTTPTASVFRDATTDLAEITLQIGLYNSAQITLHLGSAQLRELARRLLDAAADIDANPAAKLMQQAAS